MKKVNLIITSFCLWFSTNVMAEQPSDLEQIQTVLQHYIEGTANGQPERLAIAFHPDFNLYSVTEEQKLRTWKGSDYVGGIKVGKKNSRIGKIVSIDYEKDAAVAKATITIPGWRVFTDYFLLLKYEGAWKIVHKSYTSRKIEGSE